MNYPAVRSILRSFRSGSSWPVLVETSDNHRYVMKWRGIAEGPGANAADFVSLRMAHLFGIPVPTPRILELRPDVIDPKQDPELNDLIRRSVGTNLGIEEVTEFQPYESSRLNEVPQMLRDLVYGFDVLFLNMDRIESNPNMVFTSQGLLCWDLAAMMEMRKLLERRTLKDELLYPLLRRHPFYIPSNSMSLRMPAIDRGKVAAIIEELPEDWSADGVEMNTVVSGLTTILAQADSILHRRLTAIDATAHESPAERSNRSSANRRAFEDAVDRLSKKTPPTTTSIR